MNRGKQTHRKSAELLKRFMIKKWHIVVLLLVTLIVGWLVKNVLFIQEEPLHILRDNVLVSPSLIDKIKVINSKANSYTIDPSYELAARITPHLARSLISKQILKACIRPNASCSSPTWVRYDDLGSQAELGAPSISANTTDVVCTFTWRDITSDNIYNYQDMVCINPESGELWYEYFEL